MGKNRKHTFFPVAEVLGQLSSLVERLPSKQKIAGKTTENETDVLAFIQMSDNVRCVAS